MRHSIKRRILAIVAAIACGFGLVTAVASPASASYSNCPSSNGSITILGCLWPNANGNGNPYLMGAVAGCHNLTGGWANIASSVRNRTDLYEPILGYGFLIRLWPGPNCSGPNTDVDPGDQFNLPYNWFTMPLNDDAESWAAYTLEGTNFTGPVEI